MIGRADSQSVNQNTAATRESEIGRDFHSKISQPLARVFVAPGLAFARISRDSRSSSSDACRVCYANLPGKRERQRRHCRGTRDSRGIASSDMGRPSLGTGTLQLSRVKWRVDEMSINSLTDVAEMVKRHSRESRGSDHDQRD